MKKINPRLDEWLDEKVETELHYTDSFGHCFGDLE